MSGRGTLGPGVEVGVDVDDEGTDVGTLVGDGGDPICCPPGMRL